jgi:hypothetical protein
MKKLQRGLPKGRYSKYGYKRNSPDVNKPFNIIPSGNITMKDVDFPVRGVDNLGNEIVMMPGREYTFPGDYVVETPYQKGGESNATYNSNWLNKYQDAGEVPPKDNYIEVRSGNTFDDYITNPLINGIARGLDVTGDWLNNTLQSATKNALETMYNSPTTASTAARIQYGARPWLGKNIRPVAYPGIFTAPIELTRGALGMNPPPSKDAQGDYSVEEEAWRKALGLQMNPKYIVPSNYKPSKAKNPNAQYYTLNRDVIDPQLLIAEAKRRNLQEGQSVVISSLAPYIRENFMPKDEFSQIDPLQNFTIGVGKDKKGKYVSIYDKYDFEGPLNSFITPYEFYDRYYYQRAGQTSPTYFGGTLPTADIVSDNSGTQYPYYKNLTDEEKRFFSSNTPIGRAVRAKAQTGKVGQTYNDLSKAAKTIGKTAAEFTGVPGAVRFSRNPSENLKGALSTIEKTIIGASPGVPQSSTPYDSKEVEGFFNTLDAAGLASTGAPLVKTGISGARALPVVARQAGRYATTQTPLRNAWKLNPWAFKPNPEAYYRMIGKEGYADALESGVIRPPQTSRVFDQGSQKYIDIPIPAYEEAYYNAQFPLDRRWYPKNKITINPKTGKPRRHINSGYEGPYMAEITGNSHLFENGENVAAYTGPNASQTVTYSKEFIPINTPGVKFYKEDWLRGYKEVPKSINKDGELDGILGDETKAALEDWQKKNSKKQLGGALLKAQFGAFGTIPTSPPFMPQKENVVTSKKVDNLPKIKVNTTVPDEMITIKDGRKIRLTTGQAINPNTDLVGKSYSTKALRSILNTAKNRGLSKNDALTLAAMDLQETRWGETDDHMGHVLYGNNSTISPAENFINAYLRSKETANRLKLSDEYTRLQVYNGLGKVTPNTEKDYHGFRMKKIYGVPVPKSGIDMKKNPLYGKQIVDIRDNVLKQNSEFLKLVDEYYKMGGITNEMLDVYKNYINGVYTNTEKEKDAIKVYDKLNRKYYREAKNANKSVPNYIMSLIK